MKLGALIFAGFFIFIGGLLAGMEVGWRQRDADKIVYLTKTCPAQERMTPRWDCGTAEAKTYCTTCLRRRWL